MAGMPNTGRPWRQKGAYLRKKPNWQKKLAKDLKTIEQSNSLESIRTRMEYLRQQLSRLDEERRDILNSEEELRLLEERLKDLKSQLSE